MSAEENKAIVRRFFESFNARTFDDWDEICVPSMVTHQGDNPDCVDLEHRKQADAANIAAFPDMDLAIQDMIAADDKVVVRFMESGTHRGAWGGIPPTGKQHLSPGIIIYRLGEGKIVEEWISFDFMPVLRQLDILPPWEDLVERAKGKQA